MLYSPIQSFPLGCFVWGLCWASKSSRPEARVTSGFKQQNSTWHLWSSYRDLTLEQKNSYYRHPRLASQCKCLCIYQGTKEECKMLYNTLLNSVTQRACNPILWKAVSDRKGSLKLVSRSLAPSSDPQLCLPPITLGLQAHAQLCGFFREWWGPELRFSHSNVLSH